MIRRGANIKGAESGEAAGQDIKSWSDPHTIDGVIGGSTLVTSRDLSIGGTRCIVDINEASR